MYRLFFRNTNFKWYFGIFTLSQKQNVHQRLYNCTLHVNKVNFFIKKKNPIHQHSIFITYISVNFIQSLPSDDCFRNKKKQLKLKPEYYKWSFILYREFCVYWYLVYFLETYCKEVQLFIWTVFQKVQ